MTVRGSHNIEILKEYGRNRLIDLTGKRFGKWIVLERGKRKEEGRVFWLCKCDCGATAEVTSHNLRTGGSKGCSACKSNIHARKRPYEWLYHKLQKGAKERNHECSLTYDQFLEYTKIPNCYYCGNPVTWKAHSTQTQCPYNIDRKDNSIGYTKDNCVVCCPSCNKFKLAMHHEAFLQKILTICKNLKLN